MIDASLMAPLEAFQKLISDPFFLKESQVWTSGESVIKIVLDVLSEKDPTFITQYDPIEWKCIRITL